MAIGRKNDQGQKRAGGSEVRARRSRDVRIPAAVPRPAIRNFQISAERDLPGVGPGGELMPPALVLFDIDGTLVRRAGPHHRQALVDAVRDVTGLETTTEGIPVQGMIDPDILSLMLLHTGMDPARIRRLMPEIVERSQDCYKDVPDLRDKTCIGARELLEELQRREVLLALVTGNLTRIGWHKL